MFEIGNSLREARLRQALDFPEIEQATKIRGKYLRALEAEQFELLPAQTYVKGFLRSYAEFLGLDGQLYVDEYNSRYVTGEDDVPFRPRRAPRRSTRQRRIEANAVVGTLVGIAVVTALVIAAWKFGGSEPSGPRTPGPVGLRAPQPARAELVLKAVRGPSGIEVHLRSSGGRQLWRGTLEQGRSQQFFVAGRLWLAIGRPDHLAVTLNGRRVVLPAKRVFVTAKRVSAAPAGS